MYKENSENELGFSTLYLFEDDAFVFAAINPECDPENESIDQRRILRGFRSTGAGDGGSGTTSTTNLAGQACRVVGSAEVAGSGDWEHLVELNDDKECTPLAELTRLPPDSIKLPVCAVPAIWPSVVFVLSCPCLTTHAIVASRPCAPAALEQAGPPTSPGFRPPS